MTDELPEVLRKACEEKVNAELLPVSEQAQFLQLTLTDFIDHYGADVRRRTVGAMLVAIGVEPPLPDPRFAESSKDLRGCLLAMLEWVGGLPVPIQEDPPSSEPEPAIAVVALPAMQRPADPEDIAAADRIMNQITAMDFCAEHPLRLAHLLQALVADCRMLMQRLPSTHHKTAQLSSAIRTLGSVRKRENVDAFILGLAREHREDWSRVANEARARIARFDRDTENAITPGQTTNGNGKKTNGNGVVALDPHEWPELARLRARIEEGKKVIIVGGWQCRDKMVLVKTRLGVDVEWYETDPNKPLAAEGAVQRIKGGRVAAVVVLESLLTHKDWKRIVAACDAGKIPRACANRGGIGSFEKAFAEVETQIGSEGS